MMRGAPEQFTVMPPMSFGWIQRAKESRGSRSPVSIFMPSSIIVSTRAAFTVPVASSRTLSL